MLKNLNLVELSEVKTKHQMQGYLVLLAFSAPMFLPTMTKRADTAQKATLTAGALEASWLEGRKGKPISRQEQFANTRLGPAGGGRWRIHANLEPGIGHRIVRQ